MPSPFPGIDPYIEDRGGWGDFHNSFLTYCRDALNDRLPENYVAKMEEHVRLVHAAGERSSPRRPDVGVFRDPGTVASGVGRGSGALLLDPVTIALQVEEVDPIRETWIEVVRLPELELVTVIEILSPTNKSGPGREEYLDKRLRLIEQTVHIVEFDFLVRGRPLPMARPMPPGHARAIVSRSEMRPDAQVYSWTIRDPMPTIPIPLAAPDPDQWLDLAGPYATAYDRGRYGRLLRYQEPLSLPLSVEDQEWAEALARRGKDGSSLG